MSNQPSASHSSTLERLNIHTLLVFYPRSTKPSLHIILAFLLLLFISLIYKSFAAKRQYHQPLSKFPNQQLNMTSAPPHNAYTLQPHNHHTTITIKCRDCPHGLTTSITVDNLVLSALQEVSGVKVIDGKVEIEGAEKICGSCREMARGLDG